MSESLCICAEPIRRCGKYPCGHILCDRCVLRLRTIMKDKACPFCREEAASVALLESPTDEPALAKYSIKSAGIVCSTIELKEEAIRLSRMPCPKCGEEAGSLNALKSHVQQDHHLSLCGICAHHKFEFSDEFRLFSPSSLAKHTASEHVRCTLCQQKFFGSEELAKHRREKHEACFICAHRDPHKPHHYANYNQLFAHFRSEHHCCPVAECVADKFVVFASALELQDHMLERHKELVGSGRRARHVDLDVLHARSIANETSGNSAGSSNTRETTYNRPRNTAAPVVPTPVESVESVARKRYEERLKIIVQQDPDRLQQIHDANNTFATKFVPPPVFWSTYQRIIPDADDQTLLSLLTDLVKFSKFDNDRRQSLELLIKQRTPTSQPEEQAETSPPRPGSSASARANTQPKTFASQVGSNVPNVVAARVSTLQNSTPRLPQAVAPTSNVISAVWGSANSSRGGGRLDLQNLPKLGQPGGDKKKPDFMSRPSAIASTKSTNVRVRQKVPLPEAGAHPLWNQGGPMGPQTRVPYASRAEALASWTQAQPPAKPPSTSTAAAAAAIGNLTIDSQDSEVGAEIANTLGMPKVKAGRRPRLPAHQNTSGSATAIFARPQPTDSKGKRVKTTVLRIV